MLLLRGCCYYWGSSYLHRVVKEEESLLYNIIYICIYICNNFVPQIAAQPSIFFQALFDPAFKRGRPLYGTGLYLHT